MVLALFGCVPLFYLWQVARRPNPWPRRFLRSIGWLAGARVRLLGEPLRDGVVLLANHVSWLDIPLLAGATGTAFVAHSGLADNPLLKRLCTTNRTVFVERAERSGVPGQVRQVRQALDRGGALTIFVEGTTGDGVALLPFKSALLSALDPPPVGLLVQPVWLDYGPDPTAVAWVGEETGINNAARILARREPLPMTLHFLEPFDPARFGDRKAIAAEARARIEARMAAGVALAR